MRQPAGARVRSAGLHVGLLSHVTRWGTKREGQGGPESCGAGGHECALHRVPRRPFVQLRDDLVWDEPQVAVEPWRAAARKCGLLERNFTAYEIVGSRKV